MNASDAKKPAAFGLSKNVISMGTVSFLNDLSSDMIFPFIPAFVVTVLGGSAAFVGVIEGVADATQSILKIISPWHVLGVRFLDRLGKGTRDAPRDALLSFSTEHSTIGRAFGFTAAPIHWALQSDPLLQSSSFPLSETIFALFFSSRFLQAPPRSSYFLSPSKKSFEQMEKKNWS